MRHWYRLVPLCAALGLLIAVAQTQESGPDRGPGPVQGSSDQAAAATTANGESLTADTAHLARSMNAQSMMREVRVMLEREESVIAKLQVELRNTKDRSRAVELVRQIEFTKLYIERSTLNIQLIHAGQAKNLSAVHKLTTAIAALDQIIAKKQPWSAAAIQSSAGER